MGKESLTKTALNLDEPKRQFTASLPDVMDLYRHDIEGIEPLADNEISALGTAIQAGIEARRDLQNNGHSPDHTQALQVSIDEGRQASAKLAKHFVFLVFRVAREYQDCNFPFEDLIARGNIGLMKAALRYNPRYKFVSFAKRAIRNEIRDEIREQQPLVPHQEACRKTHYISLATQLYRQLGHIPTVEELAEKAGIDPENKWAILKRSIDVATNLINSKELVSLDSTQSPSGDNLLDRLDLGFATTEQEAMTNLSQKRLYEILSTLSEKQRAVIALRYGLYDGKLWILKDIGQVMGLSRKL